MKKNKVVVRLMGRDYSLLTDQAPERVTRTGRYVDRKMRELSITARVGEPMLPTLTAMTLADELFTAQEEVIRLRRELAALHSAKEKPEQD